MAGPQKGLKTLIRLGKFQVDEKRRILVALQNREDQIIAQQAQADEQLKLEQQLAGEDSAGVGFGYGFYHQAWMQQREQRMAALAQVRAEIETARDDLAEAFKSLKTYETTQAARDKAEQAELDRKDRLFMDEIGQNQHRLKQERDEA